ncbi:MAG: ATP-dependent 6-phosphofructokinase [Planctomycetes bacterium]|nr:ATP-dependent 6-phosphofructokinase [Planctomycetota bacterium]
MTTPECVGIECLGECKIKSPLNLSTVVGDGVVNFVPEQARMPMNVEITPDRPADKQVFFEKAGPREMIYFNPAITRAAIVTCGGLCPGLNNVIRSIFLELYHRYGARNVLGIRYGYAGLDPSKGYEPIELTPEFVEHIHKSGGTVLGSSRGPIGSDVAVRSLKDMGVSILFCIGGDGTQTGASKIVAEAKRQGYKLAVVGIPKTIDNDIKYVWQTFGYYTAVDKAREVIDCAHNEARGAPNGISLVKLMGRDAGFIAAGATVASQDVNFTLVPEVPFELEGGHGLLNLLRKRILDRRHAVIVVAEGAGQHLLKRNSIQCDAPGNVLHEDIGPFLKEAIQQYFSSHSIPVSVKYIDPSYIIRSVPANCEDALLCDQMARNAVHAAMAGKTGLLIGYWYNVFIHVPIPLAISEKKYMSPESGLWRSTLAATGQPVRIAGD